MKLKALIFLCLLGVSVYAQNPDSLKVRQLYDYYLTSALPASKRPLENHWDV